MIILFLLTLWLGSYLTKDFWGKTAAKVVTVINILIAIPVILNIKNVDFLTSIALSIGYAAVFVALNVLIALLILGYDSIFGGSPSDTTQEETKKEPPPPPPSEEQQALTQKEFSKYEKYCLDVTGKLKCDGVVSDGDCFSYMLANGKLKSKNGNILTSEMVQKMIAHRKVTNKCIELDLNPKNKDDRESAEYLVKADEYDEEDEYDYDDDDEDEEDYDDSGYSSGYSRRDDEDEGYYIVQFWGDISGWCDTGFSRSSETSAQNMFDYYVSRNPSSRSRLVQKRNGRVVAVLGSN